MTQRLIDIISANNEPTIRFSVAIPLNDSNFLDTLAEKKNMSKAELCRRLLAACIAEIIETSDSEEYEHHETTITHS